MFSVPVSVKNKKEMIDMFETLAHFPDTVMMLRNGDNTDDNLKQAISKFAFVNA